MSFVYPWFLFAALVISIPIIIHLFYFRKFKKIYFPNVRFLKELKEEKNAIEKLKKRLVLASRILALLFLVLAFTQPFIRKNTTNKPKGNTAVSIYVDNSFSMSLQEGGESLLNIAKSKATDIVNAYNSDDKFLLLTNDFEGRHQHWMGKEDFLSLLDKVVESPNTRNMGEISNKQKSLFETASAQNKEAFLISDFQKYTLSKISDSTYKINILPISSKTPKNIYIDTCWFTTPIQSINSPILLVYRVKTCGDVNEKTVRLSLKINGKIKGVSEVNIDKKNEIIDTLSFSVGEGGWQTGELEFNDYPINFDDHFYFTFNINQQRNVLSVEDGVGKPFIRSIFDRDAFYQYSISNPNSITADKLKSVQLLILNELTNIPTSIFETLKEYTENGGSLYVIPSKNSDLNSYNGLFSLLQTGKLEPMESKELSANSINVQEEIFNSIFQSIPKNIEMPKVTKYFPISGAVSLGQNTLIELNNGRPLVSKYTNGLGQIFLQAVPLGSEYSTLAASPIFPAMVYNFGIFNTGQQNIYYIIGKNNFISLDNKLTNDEGVYKISNSEFEYIPSQRPAGRKIILGLNNQISKDGIYDIKNSMSILAKIALNHNHQESDLIFAKTEEIETAFAGSTFQIMDENKANLKTQIKQVKQGIVLWKLCLIFALIFLLLEILFLRFIKQ